MSQVGLVDKALTCRPRGHEFESCCIQAKSFACFLLKLRPLDGSRDFYSACCKNQAMLWSIEHYITLLLLFNIAFKCILNVYWPIALLKKVFNFEIRSFFHFPTPKKPFRTNFLPSFGLYFMGQKHSGRILKRPIS